MWDVQCLARKTLYNSSQHFCRSLYDKRLRENGYFVYEIVDNIDSAGPPLKREFELDSCLVYKGDEAKVTGLKNRLFFLHYYGDHRSFPLNLNRRYKNRLPEKSKIYFLYDECVIRNDGTRPGESITFSGSIGSKRVGASLPDDYYPDY